MTQGNCFWKWSTFAAAIQVIVCVDFWILAFVLPLRGDLLMESIVYFYWPIMWFAWVIGVKGELGPFIAGLLFGWVIYGVLFGSTICAIQRLNARLSGK